MSERRTDVTRVVKVPIGEVWAIVAAFGAEVLWFPNVRASSLKGYGIGSVRTIYFKKSPMLDTVDEKLLICDGDIHHIRWSVSNENIPGDFYSNIVLKELEEGVTEIQWYAEGDTFPEELQRGGVRQVLESMYNDCIDSIVAKAGVA